MLQQATQFRVSGCYSRRHNLECLDVTAGDTVWSVWMLQQATQFSYYRA